MFIDYLNNKEARVKTGTMFLYKNMTAWTSRLQQFWWRITNRPYRGWSYSHSAVYYGKADRDRELVAEAKLQVGLSSFVFDPKHHDLWEPVASEAHCAQAVDQNLAKYEDTLYGFISWLTIVLRGILTFLFPKDNVKKMRILWSWGVICTEFCWHVMNDIATLEIESLQDGTTAELHLAWVRFRQDLRGYNPNTFTPPDMREVYERHPMVWVRKYIAR